MGLCRGCAVGGGLAVQEELTFPLNHAGASFLGRVSALCGSWQRTGDRPCPCSFHPGTGSETRCHPDASSELPQLLCQGSRWAFLPLLVFEVLRVPIRSLSPS